MNSSASRPSRIARVDAGDVADEAELGVAGDGADQPGVLAADADGVVAVEVDGRDELRVDLADQHHPGDVDGLGVGDPQPVAELGRLAEAVHQRADLRTAAVDDDRAQADEAHQHDVLGEDVEGVVLGRAGEGVAAVLDDDRLAGEAADVRQRLDEDVGDVELGVGGAHGRAHPSVSARESPRQALGCTRNTRMERSWGEADEREAERLVEAEGDVGRLQGAAGRALGEVVEGGERHHGAGALVVAGRDVDGVGAERGLRRRRPVDDDDERLVVVGVVRARRAASPSTASAPAAGRA